MRSNDTHPEKTQSLLDELVEYSHRCYDRGLIAGTSGNISARAQDNSGLYIKKSGISFGDVTREDFVFMDWEGNSFGDAKPSKEYRFHLGILRNRRDCNAVVHVHPPLSIALSMKYTEFPLATITLQKLIGRVPIVSEADPGSEDLAQHVVEAFYDEEVNITALRGHGIVAAGDSLTRAYVWVDLLEHESKVAHYLQY